MQSQPAAQPNTTDETRSIDGMNPTAGDQREQLEETVELFQLLARSGEHDLPSELRDLASLLVQLAELSSELQDQDRTNAESQGSAAEFLIEAAEVVKSAAHADPESLQRIAELKQLAIDRWGDLIASDQDLDGSGKIDEWEMLSEHDEGVDEESEEVSAPSAEDITRLLAGLPTSSPDPVEPAEPPDLTATQTAAELRAATSNSPDADPPLEGELRDAFLDDAERCVASLEDALLTLESQPEALSPLRQILRELHTLKGASGSVGLEGLASFIHDLEESLRKCEAANSAPDIESLLAGVDTIRRRVDEVRSPGQTASPEAGAPTAAPAPADSTPPAARANEPAPDAAPHPAPRPTPQPAPRFEDTATEEETVRVRTSQLNRLMDLLSQLVMLRNRRGMELADLEEIHHQLIHGVSRLRVMGDEGISAQSFGRAVAGTVEETMPQLSRINEITNDLFESAQRLRSCFRPVAEGNAAVSQFIRQFRQELVELQRTPVSGLFRRLRRSVRDAARLEGKQVELSWVGEETGIERSLQEKVYEPLLHIVRNCVSHGIESPEGRVACGKSAAGQIILAAHSGPDLLVIEVRDDGRGLDYDAIRRRALERGLLKADMAPSREELAQLIFQPGFSTREVTNELAGRGVGMDVVAATLDRLRGWIQVDSESERGTTIRLNIPLPSVIQHTMLLRSSGQLFALPMQFVHGAGGDAGGAAPIQLAELLAFSSPTGTAANDPAISSRSGQDGELLILDCGAGSTEESSGGVAGIRRVALWVDEIVGPEEVVVRPLPALLKQHPLCTGATLSGMGETVLVLDAHGLAALGVQHLFTRTSSSPPAAVDPEHRPSEVDAASEESPTGRAASPPRFLVTDDSVTARKRLARSLRRYDVEIVEASDGSEALELLRRQPFAAVFSDLEMPNVDGLDLLAELKGRERTQQIPVVIVSSRTEDEFQSRARELGADGYLGKPIDDETLDRSLREIPGLRAAVGEQNFHEPSTR